MKTRITLLLVLIAFVLLSTGAGALSASHYQVETGTISGGSYQLTSFDLRVTNVATGGAYRLLGPASSVQQGSGCCCTFLPAIMCRK
jgi:hypothetical protein